MHKATIGFVKNSIFVLFLAAVVFSVVLIGGVSATVTSVDLTSPVGGESWSGIKDIEWTSVDCDPMSDYFNIQSSTGGPFSTIATVPCAPEVYAWNTNTVSDGNNYQIRIFLDGNLGVNDISGLFTIDNHAPTTTEGESGTKVGEWWYTTDVTVTLTCTDTGPAGCDETYYTINGGSQQTYSSPFIISDDGTHTLAYWSVDNAGNTESQNIVTIKIDKTPPTSTLFVSLPKYGADPIYVTSLTQFTPTADDNPGGSGVQKMEYMIDSGDWEEYPPAFTLSGESEGSHTVYYRSTDYANNVETEKSLSVYLDDSGPSVTNLDIYLSYVDGTTYVSGTSTITADVIDSGSDVDYCEYTLDGSTWSSAVYDSGICTATSVDTSSASSINMRATDKLGNTDEETAVSVTPDTTLPTTTDNSDTNWHVIDQPIILSPSDGTGSGVADTYYCIYNSGESACDPTTPGTSVSVTCPADSVCEKVVRYYSEDNVENQEVAHDSNDVMIDKEAPTVTVNGEPANWIVTQTGYTASAICDDGDGSGCDGGTLVVVYKTYDTDPGTCSNTYADYTDSANITDHKWVCAAQKDDMENEGFSSPVEFKVASTIQDAIDSAFAGDTIDVAAGTHVEDLVITTDDLELVGEDKTTTTIKGIANVYKDDWPLGVPNIEILADNVVIHGFTIEGPDYVADYYASGIILDGENIEIYDNNFVTTQAENTDELAHAITTVSKTVIPTADVSGLYIHDNTFTGSGATGCEAIYINPHTGTGTITIDTNQFSGSIYVGITAESGKIDVTGNTINTAISGLYGVRFMDTTYAATYDNIVVSGNNIQNFEKGIRVGNGGDGDSVFVASILSNTLSNNDIGIWTRKGSQVTATYNLISGNTVGIQNDIATVVDAETNWWGDPTGPYNLDNNPMGEGDDVSDNVDFYPWAYNTDMDVDTEDPTTKINSPATSSWQKTNFQVDVSDSDTGGSELYYCEYRILSDGGETVTWTDRECNDLTPSITVGPGEDCRDQGADMCQIEVKATDKGGNTGIVVSRTFSIDWTAPATTDNSDTDWHATDQTIILSPGDGSGSGVANTYYCVDQTGTCTPSTPGTSVSVICASGSVCQQIVRYYSVDNAGNAETPHNSNVVKIDKSAPVTTDSGTDTNWHASDVTVTLTCNDGAGSGCGTTYYCIDQTGTCTPSTPGTSVSVICASGSVCQQIVRYYSVDNLGNAETPHNAANVVKIDKQGPPTVVSVSVNPVFGDFTTGTYSISATINDDSGSGVASCKYTVDGTNYYAAVWNADTSTCSKSLTSSDGTALTINFKGTDAVGNEGPTGTPLSRTVDASPPTTTDNSDTNWHASDQTITLSPNDGSGSGVASTYYCVYNNGGSPCTPSTPGTSVSVICASGSVCQQIVRYYSVDNLGNAETVHDSNDVNIDKTAPTITVITGNTMTQVGNPKEISATVTDSGSGVVSVTLYYKNIGSEGYLDTPMTCTGDSCTADIPVQSDNGTVPYNITATDNVGNSRTSDTYTVTVYDFVLSLKVGWNQISVPKELDNQSKNEIMDSFAVFQYDAVSKSWICNPLGQCEDQSLDSIKPGVGYFIDSGEQEVGINYKPGAADPNAPSPVVDIVSGWNLIGHMCTDSSEIEYVFNTEIAKDRLSQMLWYNTGLIPPQYDYYVPNPVDPDTPYRDDFETMEAGKGYWILLVMPTGEGSIPYTNTCSV